MKDCFDPRSYGAVADGHSKDTAAVQAAIDAAAAQGGTVRLAGGTFVCGTLYLKSNVALEITNSATLLASPDIADYGTDTHHNRYRNEPELDRCFLFAQDAENVTICGSGVIDGNAAAFPNAGSIYRPMLLRVLRCRNVRVQNLRLLNAAAWATAFLDSDFIWATDLHIENHRNYNGDGLDFDSCRHVWVRGCYIDGTDDNLCLQSSGLPVQDVHISDCAFTSVCVGIRIGLKSIGEISGVVISNCTMRNIWREGINGHYKDGSIDIMNDGAYKMVETMKKWYAEGLIQPEWVAGTFGEADWEAAMLNGNGSVFFDYYNRAEWFMENGGPDNDPNYQMGVLNFIKDDNGNPQKMPVSMKYNDECVTAINANCSEDKIKTILTFIDYFYSEEGEILANYGVEGESFKDTNGDKEFIVDYQTEEATPAGEKRWSFLSDRFTVCKPVDNEAFFKWNAPLIAEATGRLFTDENLGTSYVLKFTDDQSKEVTNLLASVYDAQMSGIAQFIDGTRELTPDNWAAFQQEMNDLGLSRIEEIQLAAYQAMYGA